MVKRSSRGLRRVALGAVLGVTAATTGAQPSDGCPREVRDAMTSWGQDGVNRAASVIRSEEMGIAKPESVFDFSCLTDLFQVPNLYFFHGGSLVDGLIGGLHDFVCEFGQSLFEEHLGRPLGQLAFWDEAPRVPGLEIGVRWGARDQESLSVSVRPVQDVGGGGHQNIQWFRSAIGTRGSGQ